MKSSSLSFLVLASASIQVPSYIPEEMVQGPQKLKLVAGNTLCVGFILISVNLLIGYITFKIVMTVRDQGDACAWQALFSAASYMSQTLTTM